MGTILQDLIYGCRVLMKNPGYASVAVLTLALGIGFNSSIFSLVDAVILRPLPYPNPEQLVGLGQWRNQQGQGYIQTGVSAPNLDDIAKSGVFQYVAYYRWAGLNLTEGSRPESLRGIKASAELLPMFGVAPQLGRYLLPAEMNARRDRVAVIGHRLWQMRYGSDPGILGKTIDLDERRYTVVGVMPASFRFTWDQEIDVFTPLVLSPEERSEIGRGTSRDLQAQARVKAGVSLVQAQAAMNVLAENLGKQYPIADRGWGFKVEPLHAAYHRHMQTPLLIMLSAVLFVLLIACANVANILLARATGRRREVAIRVAIGASRGQLMKQLLTESLLLAGIGGGLGLVLAYAGDRLLTFAMTRYDLTLPNASVIEIDWRVLLFSLVVTVATGVIFGLAPAWITTKVDCNEALKEGGSSTTTDSGRRRLRNALVIAEISLALVLLTGAGLLVRTFVQLADIDLGIDPANVMTMGVSLPAYKYPSAEKQAVFYRELFENLNSAPGIKSAGAEGGGSNVFFQPQGQPAALPGQEPTASYKIVMPNFFKTVGMRLMEGREFSAHDGAAAKQVAIISETAARHYWPHSNPVGSHLTLLSHVYSGQSAGTAQPLEIVGVVKDVRNESLWTPEADVYVPFEQHPVSSVLLVVKSEGAPASAVASVRAQVLDLDKEQPLSDIKSMNDIVSQTYGAIRFPMMLLWIFAALALILSAIGIFGVMSYTVSRRTQEMAIRLALGASRGDVLRLILSEALRVTAFGVCIGLIAALALSRVMAGYLYQISATDPLTLVSASVLLAGVALFASYLPARRAMKISPITALRYE
ncbi:MAG: ABC transporter permease [Acidobacteriota bacterium]|nr:ABC transporter permease [Acidobacteriota bacterium]